MKFLVYDNTVVNVDMIKRIDLVDNSIVLVTFSDYSSWCITRFSVDLFGLLTDFLHEDSKKTMFYLQHFLNEMEHEKKE